MSYPEEEVEINPKLSLLCDKVSFSFLIPKEYENINKINVEIKIILDIVYLKEEVKISSSNIEIKDKKILIEINSFPLDKIDENFQRYLLSFELKRPCLGDNHHINQQL